MPTEKLAKQKVVFSILAPEAKAVQLAGDFTQWQAGSIELKRLKNGLWKTTCPLAPGRYEYRFLVDGAWCGDPHCTGHAQNEFGGQNCVRIVASAAS